MTSLSTLLVTGTQQTVTVGNVVGLYRNIVSSSIPTKGRIQSLGKTNQAYCLTANFRTTDCDKQRNITTFKVYSLKTNQDCIDSVRCISDIPRQVCETVSDTSLNGRYHACLKGHSLEIWDRQKLLKTLSTAQLDVHGPISTDVTFSNFVWCPFGEQDKLLYVCLPKPPKHESFFKNPTDTANYNRGEQFIHREDWGNFLDGINHTLVAILDVADNFSIKTIEVEGHSLGNPQWIDNGSKIVSVAYNEKPERLGVAYTNNRASKILVHDWRTSNQLLELASDTECFHTPRVNNAGNKFLYMKNPVHGVYFHAVKLYIYDLATKTSTALVDEVTKGAELCIVSVPKHCFTSDDKHILFVKADHLYHHMCLFSLKTSRLSKIKFPTVGLSIMDFRYDIILASGHEVNTTPTVFVAKLCLANITGVVAWHQIEDCVHLDEIEYEAHKIPTSDKSSFVSAIFVKPDINALNHRNMKIGDDNKLPTVVRIHGGPHSAFHVCYSPEAILYSKLGLQSIFINYRGSFGVSQEYTESITGKVGTQDVDDCLQVIRHFVKENLIDPKKLVVQGASHGGFLSCHLSCQNEFKFTSAILLNPLIDISSNNQSLTHWPDWAHVEVLQKKFYDPSYVFKSEDLVKMYECSPLSKVNESDVPTLVFLGSQDRAVPNSQGKNWLRNLQARGVETLCKVYPDGHSLTKPENTLDAVITAVIWILNHLPKQQQV